LFPLDEDFGPALRNFIPAVAEKSVSHHHPHSAWQRTERWRGYGDTGIMEMDRATADVHRYRGSGGGGVTGVYIRETPG